MRKLHIRHIIRTLYVRGDQWWCCPALIIPLFQPFRGNVGCLRQAAAPDTQAELYGVRHILNNPKLMPDIWTDLWRSGCIPALFSAPPQTAPWNVSVRASPAGTEGPFVLWRQNITSMFLRTDTKNRDSSHNRDFMRALIGLVLVSLINRRLKKKNLKLYTKYNFSFSCQGCSITGSLLFIQSPRQTKMKTLKSVPVSAAGRQWEECVFVC